MDRTARPAGRPALHKPRQTHQRRAPYRPGAYKIVRSLGESVGIRTRPHGIRHATITQRIHSGMTLPEVQDFSRHSDIKTLMIYNDRLTNAAGKLATMADAEI